MPSFGCLGNLARARSYCIQRGGTAYRWCTGTGAWSSASIISRRCNAGSMSALEYPNPSNSPRPHKAQSRRFQSAGRRSQRISDHGGRGRIAISQGPLLNSCEPFFPPIDIITRDQIAWVQPLPPAGEEKATIEQTRVGKPFEAAMRPDLIERIRKAE